MLTSGLAVYMPGASCIAPGFVLYIFTNVGIYSFVVPVGRNVTVDLLIVAGGGGGGSDGGISQLLSTFFNLFQGGGGAGALLSYTGQVQISGNYTISVGAGGAGGNYPILASNGGNSLAFNWTAIGGGAAGPSYTSVPLSLFRFCCLGNAYANGYAGGLFTSIFSSADVLHHSIADIIKGAVEG